VGDGTRRIIDLVPGSGNEKKADDLFPSVSSVAVGADAHLTPGARKPITDPLGLGSSIGMIAVI